MEKKTIVKSNRYKNLLYKILIIGYLGFFVLLLVTQLWISLTGPGYSISSLIYWTMLVGMVGYVLKKKLTSNTSLLFAFSLFVLASVLSVFGLLGLGEVFMKISFIGWVIGISQALLEYKKKKGYG